MSREENEKVKPENEKYAIKQEGERPIAQAIKSTKCTFLNHSDDDDGTSTRSSPEASIVSLAEDSIPSKEIRTKNPMKRRKRPVA
ncbi:hypothetical protein GOBAR_DD21214 [Gossypium barbadense]|nr:hypothetical protein GOBAR_DD21214 [Gossypium barbadense]